MYCSFGLCRGQCLSQFRLSLYTFHTVSSLVFFKPQIHPYANWTEVKRSSKLFEKTEKYPYVFGCMSQRVWKSEWNCFFLFTVYFFLPLFGALWFQGSYHPSASQYVLFLKLLKKPFSWSVRKAQRARLRLLYPSDYPSSEHALDLNADGQLPSDLSQDVQAGLAFLCCQEVWNLFFFGRSAHSDHCLRNTFHIYSRASWRTRHIYLLFGNRYASQNSSQWNNSEVCPFHDRTLIHHGDKHPKFISTSLLRFTWEVCTLKWVHALL